MVEILRRAVQYESSYAFFWEEPVIAVFLRCFSNASFTTEQMNVLLKAITKEKAACVKDCCR